MVTKNLTKDPELVQRAREMRAAGATYAQIRTELGVGSFATVGRLLGVKGKGGRRPRLRPEVRERARDLRGQGSSVPEISRELGIARSTAWNITKDIAWTPGPDSASRRAEAGRRYWEAWHERRDIERETARAVAAAHVGELTERELLLLGAVLYWAEGGKAKPWNRSEYLDFINSDPDVIQLYLAWLRLLGVPPERLAYRVSIHASADVPAAVRFWAGVVGVPEESFSRSTLKRHNPTTVRKNTGDDYHGCLIVRVRRSTAEYWRMEGVWRGIIAAVTGIHATLKDGREE